MLWRLCPTRHTGKPRETRDRFYETSTHYWEGLQSQGKWSWLCCCKFLAISPILFLDLLLATGFSCHKNEYHVLKKKKINILHHIRISSFSCFQEKQQINSFALRIHISHRAHKKETPHRILSKNTYCYFSHLNYPAHDFKVSLDSPTPAICT